MYSEVHELSKLQKRILNVALREHINPREEEMTNKDKDRTGGEIKARIGLD